MNISNFKFQIFGFILLLILAFRFFFFYHNQTQLANGQQLDFETTILTQPQIAGSQQGFSANYKNNKIRIVTSRFPELNYGDSVSISGIISNKNGGVLMYFPKIETVNNSGNILQGSLRNVNVLRQKLVLLFSKTLPSPYGSLLTGIVFGIREQMPKDFSDNLKTTGVFHVIAASGMNVTLIGGFISSFFAFFLKRQIAVGLSILGIMFYAVLAGLEPSIVRASIMGVIVFSAQIMGRQSLAVNGLFLAGFVMLFISPDLILDIGFQLSFAATAGLIFIPKIRAIGKIKVIGDNINTTIAAQIATLPILLANFGTYSVYSVLVNGLVLWTVSVLMVIGAVGALVGLIFIPLGQIVLYLSYPLLIYFEKIVNVFGRMGGLIAIQSLSWQFVVGYYLILAAILLSKSKKDQ